MIGYNDTTYCHGDGCKAFDGCHRALTQQVRDDAVAWWGGSKDAPIAQFTDPRALDCWEGEDEQ